MFYNKHIAYGFGLVFLILLLAQISLFAQGEHKKRDNYSFSHLTVEDGLANNFCHTTFQDSQGYIWIGTQDGLTRYDGYNFTNYQDYYELGIDSLTMRGSSALDIIEDKKGWLWIATVGGGVVRYNPETEAFKNYLPTEVISPSENIMFVDLYLEEDSILWIGTFDIGLLKFNLTTKRFKRFNLYQEYSTDQDIFRKNSVHEIIPDYTNKDILWIGANNGLYRFDKQRESLEYFPISLNGIPDYWAAVLDLYMDSPSSIWIGTWSTGLVHFDVNTEEWTNYYNSQRRTTFDNIIQDIEPKQEGELWIASLDKGLMIFDKGTKTFTHIKHDPAIENSILSNSVYNIYTDKDQKLWVLNYKEGISILDPALQLFQFTALKDQVRCPEGSGDAFSDFALDPIAKKIYVANSVCKALFIFNMDYELEQLIPLDDTDQGIPQYHLLLDREQNLWITKMGGVDQATLLKYRPSSNQIEQVSITAFKDLPINRFELTKIIQDKSGIIWIGTRREGLIRLDPVLEQVKQYKRSEAFPNSIGEYAQVSDLHEDAKGNIWISTLEDGLFTFDPAKEQFRHFDCYVCVQPNFGLFEKRINSVIEDKNGKIWVGTGDLGIQVLDPSLPDSQLTKAYRMEEGLPNEKINGIIKDSKDQIWIATQRGLCRYDETLDNFIVYGKNNGIKDPFLSNGFSYSKQGILFLGQEDGFYTLNTEELRKEDVVAPVVLTKFRIFEEEQVFEKNINYINRIQLEPGQNFFSFEFAALNFSKANTTRYAYQLVGFDKDWIYPSDNRNFAPYTNIPPGNYTFQVKTSTGSGDWSAPGIQKEIYVPAPWYARWWAKAIWIASIVGLFWSIYQFQIKRQFEKQEAQRLKELDSLKTRLYTNITHEFRTPLTVIMGMSETFSDTKNPAYKKAQKLIMRNSKNLLNLVNQMLDLAKLESGNLRLNLRQENIIPYLQYLTESFQSVAQMKNINLTFYTEVDNLVMDYDEEQIKQILSNLLSNALKFTPESGKIILHCSHIKAASQLQIKVKDSGIGISEENLQHIFNRFYQADNSSTRKGEGTGIGLALTKELVEVMEGSISVSSKLEKGTEFTVVLPIKREAPFKTEHPEQSPLNGEVLVDTEDLPAIIAKSSAEDSDLPLLLVVEDNPDVATYIYTILKDQYNIQIANNGRIGIEKAIEIVPDIIISDVMMPEKDGFEVCATLKQDERTSHIPIILLTAKAADEDKISGLEFGADAYLTKPFNKEELFIRLRKLVELRKQLQAQYSKHTPETSTNGAETKPAPSPAPRPIEDAFLVKLKDMVHEKMVDPNLSIEYLCKKSLLSHTQLYRKLKALTNQTPSQFIRGIRLEEAMKMLKSSELSISEIAYDVGFNDPNYFSRIFQKEFGESPSNMRKKL